MGRTGLGTRPPHHVIDHKIQNGPASAPTLPSHGLPPSAEEKDQNDMDTTTTAPASAMPDRTPRNVQTLDGLEFGLRHLRALNRNALYTLENSVSRAPGTRLDFNLPLNDFEEVVAMMRGIELFAKQALEGGR